MEGYLTVSQVARRLGRHHRTVRRLIKNGRIKAKRDRVAGTLYVEAASVDAFLAELEDARPEPPAPEPTPAPDLLPPPAEAPPKKRRGGWTLFDQEET